MDWGNLAAAGGGALMSYLAGQRSGAAPTTTYSQSVPWGPAQPYLQGSLANSAAWGSSPLPYGSPADMVAPLNNAQMVGADTIMQGTGNAGAVLNAGQNAILPFLSGQYMDVRTNPYLQATIDAAVRPITQRYEENVLPTIRTGFNMGTESYDQSKQGIAEGIAARGYLDSVRDASAAISNRGYETGLNATTNAMGQIPGLTTASVQPGQAQWNIGALLQAQAQRERDAPGAFDQLMWQRIANPAAVQTQIGGMGKSGTSTPPGAVQNPWLNALGGAMAGSSLYRSAGGGTTDGTAGGGLSSWWDGQGTGMQYSPGATDGWL